MHPNPVAPPYLKKGDRIGIVAPARKISREELAPALQWLQDQGFEPVLGGHLFGAFHQFSGTDTERANDFQQQLDDPSVKAIISARGGYGTVRIIDHLDFTQFLRHPKWIVGYSDVTVLHSHLNKLGIQSLHATMPINFFKNEEARITLLNALTGAGMEYEFPGDHYNRTGRSTGDLVGGNLSLLYALSACPDDLMTDNKILFLEDLDEYLYHIDRMMMNLKRSGKLSKLAGIVVGGMTEMKDNAVPFGKTAEQIIAEAVEEYSYPVCFNFPAGHVDRNLALRLGAKVELDVAESKSLIRFV